MQSAPSVKTGIEDKFFYEIDDSCVSCGSCASACPAHAIEAGDTQFHIDAKACIDCGTCSYVCPVGAAHRAPLLRESIALQDVDVSKCYFNAGCALSLYKPDIAGKMFALLKEYVGDIKLHQTCCRHDPELEPGSTIVNNCAGCDRRFRSLYEGINTISYWELIDAMPGVSLPDHSGCTVSIHDSCGYRHKPQVHRAVRSLLAKMNIEVQEAEFSGSESVCCGDNFYGLVENETVETRIRERAEQFPCDNVVVYCIGCVRAMYAGGKNPLYLPDLLFAGQTEEMPDSLDEYHSKLQTYIDAH